MGVSKNKIVSVTRQMILLTIFSMGAGISLFLAILIKSADPTEETFTWLCLTFAIVLIIGGCILIAGRPLVTAMESLAPEESKIHLMTLNLIIYGLMLGLIGITLLVIGVRYYYGLWCSSEIFRLLFAMILVAALFWRSTYLLYKRAKYVLFTE